MQSHTHELKRNSKTSMSMSQELRTVGQGLESLTVEDFDLEREGDGYFALGLSRSHAAAADAARKSATTALWKTLRVPWQRLTGQRLSTRTLSDGGAGVLRILFTTEGMLRLEAAGITRRNPNSAKIPDFTKPGQALRMIGEHLDAHSGSLLNVCRRGDRIAFAYATAAADERREEWMLSQLHERWVESYRRRQSESVLSRFNH